MTNSSQSSSCFCNIALIRLFKKILQGSIPHSKFDELPTAMVYSIGVEKFLLMISTLTRKIAQRVERGRVFESIQRRPERSHSRRVIHTHTRLQSHTSENAKSTLNIIHDPQRRPPARTAPYNQTPLPQHNVVLPHSGSQDRKLLCAFLAAPSKVTRRRSPSQKLLNIPNNRNAVFIPCL